MKLCHFILSGLKALHIIHLLNFFLNSTHGFGLVWKDKLFKGDMMRGREKVFTYAAFFCVCVVSLHKDRRKVAV